MLSSSNALAKGPAAAAIASMAYQPALRQQLISQRLDRRPLRTRPTSPRCDSLAALLELDVETSYHAVQAIAQFAADERFRQVLPEAGAIGPLAGLLSSPQPHVQHCALSAVANLSFVPSAVGPLCQSGALTVVGQMLFSHDAAVGGHVALLTQLSSPSPDAQSQAAMSIGHMCRHRPAVQALLQAETVPLLSHLLHSPHPAVQLQTVYALGALAAEEEAAASAVQVAGAVAPLTTLLLSSGAVEVKQHIALTLAHTALLDVLAAGAEAERQDNPGLPSAPSRRPLGCRKRGGVPTLLRLVESKKPAAVAPAARVLANLLRDEPPAGLPEAAVAPALVQALSTAKPSAVVDLLSALSHEGVPLVSVCAQWASDEAAAKVCRRLVECRADPSCRSRAGLSPQVMAARSGNAATAAALAQLTEKLTDGAREGLDAAAAGQPPVVRRATRRGRGGKNKS
ncbi:hypothetical protein EMIHUDRAFT_453228 [Emiliania huxleyi CCMP1516]|uniref:Uncharacterized protein n=2 Tax=Emiliania huxleyi TaxID=2903 RepID=A0A0D3I9M0_EMIH1|nr:hypothetical protein EMIHUDRAFT_453228 [Emiliania huxleyi CCMP1516]EOD07955.1 hypothetical protein EMIHUDRAFT_453228 [Emiliania huxleyi CCMP1516]|eukprot:XP_005760384.1 hypothetical protein EMIHUDRAFT_453228 [Emiliania huxleyi CCMP1516]